MHQQIEVVSEFDCLKWEIARYIEFLERSPYSDEVKLTCLRGYLGRLCGVDELLQEIQNMENGYGRFDSGS